MQLNKKDKKIYIKKQTEKKNMQNKALLTYNVVKNHLHMTFSCHINVIVLYLVKYLIKSTG